MSRKIIMIDPAVRDTRPLDNRPPKYPPDSKNGNDLWKTAQSKAKNRFQEGEQTSTYWKNNFFVVLLPFIVAGFPLHIIIPTESSKKILREKQNVEQWLQFRWRTPPVIWMTLLLLIAAGYLNYLFASSAVIIFNMLIIQGRFEASILDSVFELVYILPFVLMVDYSWLFGHKLNAFIQSLDTPTVLEIPSPPPFSTAEGPLGMVTSKGNGPDMPKNYIKKFIVEATKEDKTYRKVLFRAYAVICTAHIMHFFTVRHRILEERWSTETVWSYSILYTKTVGFTLIFPVYMTLCGSIACQVDSVSRFIQGCIRRGFLMSRDNIYLIKKAYEKIADSIVRGNEIFSLFLPILLIVFIFSELVNSTLAVNSGAAAKYIGVILMQTVVPGLQSFIATISKGNSSANETNVSKPENPNQGGLSPEDIRYLAGIIVQIGLCLYLLWMTLSAAIQANDKVRYLHVWLNDFAVETCSPYSAQRIEPRNGLLDVDATHSIYREFNLLKFYVHSRMEVQAEFQRALLYMKGLGLVSGFLANRLNGYHLRH